jgi:hypothetical protein
VQGIFSCSCGYIWFFSMGFLNCLLSAQVYYCTSMGPSSAILKHAQALKPSKAQLHSLTEVTACTIAHAAAQASHLCLSQSKSSDQHRLSSCLVCWRNGPSTMGTSTTRVCMIMSWRCLSQSQTIHGSMRPMHGGISVYDILIVL